MNKETIKGLLILAGIVVAVALFAVIATDNGWQKVGCVFRAILHGVALSNIRSICL
ncbi:hypothetical protein [Duganella aceris]|jgi:hypothetical protein|uniref:hypothetical protein n=1 Tax=Duganella aceris TaxID=2703883 RepID=UPI0014086D78|nr:hypothetical protein [Duganella aceris]